MRAPLIGLTICVLAASCSKAAPGPTSPTSVGPVPPQSVIGPAPPTPGPVPADLKGVWRELGSNEKMSLSGGTFRFYFNAGTFAGGRVVVTGSSIAFSGSTDCAGEGDYTWALAGHTLHFTATNFDPCPRSVSLKDQNWVLVHP